MVDFAYSVIALPFVVATVVQIVFIAYVLVHPRTETSDPVVRTLLYVLCGGVLWSAPYGVNLLVHDLPTKRLLFQLEHLGPELLVPALLLHVAAYTGHYQWFNQRRVGLLLVEPAITFGILVTNSFHHLLWSDPIILKVGSAAVFARTVGPWWYFKTTYQYVIVTIVLLLLVRGVVRSKGIARTQIAAVFVAIMIPLVVNALFDVQFLLDAVPIANFARIEFTGAALALSGLVLSYALVRLRYLDIVPAGRKRAIEHLQDPYIVVDEDRRILDANSATESLLDSVSSVNRRDITGLIPELESLFTDHPPGTLVNEEVTITRESERWFDATRLPLPTATVPSVSEGAGSGGATIEAADGGTPGRSMGYVLVLHEITELKSRERHLLEQRQQLQQVNHIVSHDLRNELHLLAGLVRRSVSSPAVAGEKQVELQDGVTRYREQADQSIVRMVNLIEAHRDFIRTMSNQANAHEPTRYRPVLRSAIANASKRRGNVNVEIDGPLPHGTVLANDMLSVVFRHVLACAIENADDAAGHVRLTVRETATAIVVQVTDFDADGTMAAQFGDALTEDDLQGRDLARSRLYLVASLLRSFDGAFEVGADDTTGTVFSVELKRA